MDFTFGITFILEKKKKPFAYGKVFYDQRGHLIEFHDPNETGKLIKGLIPPMPAEFQTPVEPKEAEPVTKESQSYHG